MLNRRSLLRTGGGVVLAAASAGAVGAPVYSAAAASPAANIQGLRSWLSGDLVLPSDQGYNLAKQIYIASYDAINPLAVAYCENADDVRNCVRFAREAGIPLHVRSGGHSAGGWSTGDGLVVDLSRINHATPSGRTVNVGPGAKSIDAVTALRPYNKQIATGTCPTVSPGGYLTGGGIGHQTRRFGLASDRLVSAQVVLADGRVVRASEHSEPDLFWGLRGGGGSFGIVTNFEVRPVDAPRMTFFLTTWAWDHAEDVFMAWQRKMLGAPNSLASQCILVLPDAAPQAVPIVVITGAYYGSVEGTENAVNDIAAQAGAQPTSRTVKDLPYAEAMQHVYGCEQLTVERCHRVGQTPTAELKRPEVMRESHRLFARAFTRTEVGTILSAWNVERRAGQNRVMHCMALGGEAATIRRSATAFVHRDAKFVIGFAAGCSASPDDIAAATALADRGAQVLDPLSIGAYVNFPSNTLPNWQTAYYKENYRRLTQVKRKYDPDNFFRHARSIGV